MNRHIFKWVNAIICRRLQMPIIAIHPRIGRGVDIALAIIIMETGV